MLKKSNTAAAILPGSVLTGVLARDISYFAHAKTAKPAPPFTPAQEARIGEVAADYLIAYPEVLVKVSETLQARQEAAAMTNGAVKVDSAKTKDRGVEAELTLTGELATDIGLTGTPGLVVMPATGVTAETVTVLPGMTDRAVLQMAINKAAGLTDPGKK